DVSKARRTRPRIIQEVASTESDIRKANVIPAGGCPRRYCWWWTSLSFEWNLTPQEGCTFLECPKPPGFRFSDIPCCRSEPSSRIDHFEPREPHIRRDGIDPSRWLQTREEKNRDIGE